MEEQSAQTDGEALDFNIDRADLYLEESFTDLKTGTVKRYSPVKADGSPDKTRKTVFVGHTSVYTPQGPLPLNSEIQAKELSQAFKRFPEAMEEALQTLLAELRKLNEEKAAPVIQTPDSRIIVP